MEPVKTRPTPAQHKRDTADRRGKSRTTPTVSRNPETLVRSFRYSSRPSDCEARLANPVQLRASVPDVRLSDTFLTISRECTDAKRLTADHTTRSGYASRTRHRNRWSNPSHRRLQLGD